jgi:chemotaxis protein MotA
MDIATIIGLILGIGCILASMIMDPGGVGPFIHIPSMMITFGGSLAALLINFPLRNVLGTLGVVRTCFTVKLPSPTNVIDQFKEFANVARRDGLLALEARLAEVSDPFLVRGMEMVIGGSSKEDLSNNLSTELTYIEQRHQTGKKILDSLAAAGPAWGMIGTLIGLVQMLRTLDDPSKIGMGMAVALITTFYGALLANLVCIPLAGKLEQRNMEEVMIRELMITGLTSLVEGQPPRTVEEKLLAYMSPSSRPQKEEARAA